MGQCARWPGDLPCSEMRTPASGICDARPAESTHLPATATRSPKALRYVA
jgi:hypothetical protein